MKNKRRALTLCLLLVFFMFLGMPKASFAETLTLVTNWGKNFYSSAKTIAWAEDFSKSEAAKAADIKIRYLGGPEVSPAKEQLTALRKGVFDMIFGAAGYYVGLVPEGDIHYAAEITPMEARANGGTELLSKIWGKKANAHFLAWTAAGGIGYHVWLARDPKLKADGTLDLRGMKIRSSGFYRPWLNSMGATNVMIPAPDVYSALDRKLVDGVAFPALGIADFGFQKFIKYRVEPKVWQMESVIIVNLDKWKSLTKRAQDAVQNSAIEFEKEAFEYYGRLGREEWGKIQQAGTKSFKLKGSGAKRHVAAAQDIIYNWQVINVLELSRHNPSNSFGEAAKKVNLHLRIPGRQYDNNGSYFLNSEVAVNKLTPVGELQ